MYSEGGGDTVGNPRRAQIYRFELFELILLSKLDKRFPVEQFEAAVSQSTVPPLPLRLLLLLLVLLLVTIITTCNYYEQYAFHYCQYLLHCQYLLPLLTLLVNTCYIANTYYISTIANTCYHYDYL